MRLSKKALPVPSLVGAPQPVTCTISDTENREGLFGLKAIQIFNYLKNKKNGLV